MLIKRQLNVDGLKQIYWLRKTVPYNPQLLRIKRWYTELEQNYLMELAESQSTVVNLVAIESALQTLVHPLLIQQYSTLLRDEMIVNDVLNQRIASTLVEGKATELTSEMMGAIKNNLDYIKQQSEFGNIVKSELKTLEDNFKLNARERLNICLEEGLNIQPNVFSPYYDMNKLFDSYARKSDRASDYDEAVMKNSIAEENGEEIPFPYKTWVWQMEGVGLTTRHESNDGQTVAIDEPFLITNDATGDTEELMYPMDSNGSPSNTYYCYCGATYHD